MLALFNNYVTFIGEVFLLPDSPLGDPGTQTNPSVEYCLHLFIYLIYVINVSCNNNTCSLFLTTFKVYMAHIQDLTVIDTDVTHTYLIYVILNVDNH